MNGTSESDGAPATDRRTSSAAEPSAAGRTPSVPCEGRLLGLDYGTRRIGVAVCDDMQIIASPLENYTRASEEADSHFLRDVVSEYRVVGIVVGLPVHMSGDEGGKAAEARAFGDWVSGITSLPVAYRDERYTSSMADDHLRAAGVPRGRRKELRDKIAAQIILQSFIESGDRSQSPGSLRY